MSYRTDILLLELLDAIRAQRSALEEGDTDKALALLSIRHGIVQEIHYNDDLVRAERCGGDPDEAKAEPQGDCLESRRSILREIFAADREVTALVRHQMSDIASRLDGIDKVKRFFRSAASPPGGNDGVVA